MAPAGWVEPHLVTRREKAVGGLKVDRVSRGITSGWLHKMMEDYMEAFLFFAIWLGGALLHTLYDLKIKPVIQSAREESDLL